MTYCKTIFLLFIIVFPYLVFSKNLPKIYKVKAQKSQKTSIFNTLKYPVNINHLGGKDGTVITSEVSGEVISINQTYGDMVQKNSLIMSIKSRRNFDSKTYHSYSPIKGQIYKVYVSNGQSIEAKEKLYSIVNQEQLEISVEAVASNINKLQQGLKGELFLIDLNKKIFVEIHKKVPFISPNSGTFKIVLKTDDKNKKLLIPGLEGTVSFQIDKREGLLVPEKSLYSNGETYTLPLITQKNKIKITTVTIGIKKNDQVEILSGLTEEDTYVASCKDYLQNDDQIKIEGE